MKMELGYYQRRFEEIEVSSVKKGRKAELLANLMTGMEREFAICVILDNSHVESDVLELYQKISKARGF